MDYQIVILFLISVVGSAFTEVAALIVGLFVVALPLSMLIQWLYQVDER